MKVFVRAILSLTPPTNPGIELSASNINSKKWTTFAFSPPELCIEMHRNDFPKPSSYTQGEHSQKLASFFQLVTNEVLEQAQVALCPHFLHWRLSHICVEVWGSCAILPLGTKHYSTSLDNVIVLGLPS